LKPIARRELGFVVALNKNSGAASTRLRRKIKLSVYGVGYLAAGHTQKMTLPKSFPKPQSCPSDGLVLLVHVSALTKYGPLEEEGLVIVRHSLDEVGLMTRRPVTISSCD